MVENAVRHHEWGASLSGQCPTIAKRLVEHLEALQVSRHEAAGGDWRCGHWARIQRLTPRGSLRACPRRQSNGKITKPSRGLLHFRHGIQRQ
jgi:hypothetical protein